MIILKTYQDLHQLNLSNHIHDAALEYFHRMADLYPEHGYLILIEKEDTEATLDLPEVQGSLKDLLWEGVVKHTGYFHAVYLTNNEFALEFIIPDIEWLPENLRKVLEENTEN